MNRNLSKTELDDLIAKNGEEIQITKEQEEICKAIGYKKELDYLLNIMGVK